MNGPKNSSLARQLGLITTIAIVIGAMIGSGIFIKPTAMAQATGSPELMLLIWVVAGVVTLFGAMSNAEVAGLIPITGGQYVFFDKMYGRLSAFFYGWAIFAVIQTGSIASIAYVFSKYYQYLHVLPTFSFETEHSLILKIPYIGDILPLQNFGEKMMTIGIIWFLSIVNYFGIKFGGRISLVFSSAKVLAILLLIGFALLFGGGAAEHLVREAPEFGQIGLIAGIIGALSGAFWAYDGWNNITYIAGEVKKPQINIPKALVIGTATVILVYLITNIAFLFVLPVEEIAASKLVASDVAEKSFGSIGGGLVAIMVMISTFGTTNGTIMVSARVYYAMARDGIFFKKIGNSHPKYFTPANALILQAFWSSLLVISGTFDTLTDMLIFVSWIFYAMSAFGVIVLRKKMPDAERPFKVPGYPWIPLIFVLFATAYLIFTLINDINAYIEAKKIIDSEAPVPIINSLFGLIILLFGLPFYIYFTKRKKNK